MSGQARDPRELRALWLRHLAGEGADPALAAEVRSGSNPGRALAADDEIHRALDALGRSAEGEQAFVEQVGRLVAAEASVDRFVSAVDRRIDAAARPGGTRAGHAGRPVDRSRPAPVPGRSGRRLLVAAPLALAAAAAVAMWARALPDPPVPAALPVALLPATVVAGTLGSDRGSLGAGAVAPVGIALASEEGRACLRLADDSQVCLERGTRLRLVAAGGPIALEAGKVAASVRPQATGATFTIGTAAVEVTAVGTAFSVELAEGGASVIARVVQGAIAVAHRGAPPSEKVTLKAHEALAAPSGTRWRMSTEEEREEWSLIRGHAAPAVQALAAQEPATAPDPERAGEAATGAAAEVPALLRLADALRARGRLRDAQGICDGLARRFPGRPEIEAIAAELRRPPPAQPWNATPAVYRINAGGGLYVDPRGNTWAADTHFTGGHPNEFQEEIDGTDMDRLYRSERFAFPGEELSYRLPVPEGRYVVRLHFAEIWAGTVKRDMRQFDVRVEGDTVLASYDIAAEVGPMTATVKQVITSVHDGSLDIELRHVLENPKISGIEVLALPPGATPPPEPAPPTVFPPLPLPPTDALYRVNAGGREYVDSQGRRWETDGYFNDTGLGAASYVDIGGTDLDPLYQTERRSYVLPTRRHLVYSFPVPPGRYLLRLHFAELDPAARAGSSRFDVLVEKAEVLRGLDVFAEAGVLTALVEEVETTTTDGAIDLSFRAIAGRPKIAAIEILPLPPTPPAAGCALSGSSPQTGPLAWLALATLAVTSARRRRHRQ